MLTAQEKQNLLDYFSHRHQKRVCANCLNYHKTQEPKSLLYGIGYCACRELVDMIRLANQCPDWRSL